MKKILSLLLSVMILVSMAGSVFAEVLEAIEFVITPEGEITAYYGESYVYIPAVVDGISVTSVGDEAFYDLDLSYVSMEQGIKTIGTSAFEGASMTGVDFASTITYIGDSAFMNCQNLEDLYFWSQEALPSFGDKAFYNTPYLTVHMYCTNDTDAFYDEFYRVKGDWEFTVENFHGLTQETVMEHGDYKLPVSVCEKCGYTEVYYPGVLGNPFTDISYEDWFYQYVDAAYNVGIINGKGADSFDPNATMTCAEAAKIAASIAAMRNGHTISKPESDAWYQPYVDYCYNYYVIEEGIHFDWNAPITRAQMAYLFCRADATNYYPNDVPITDIPDVTEETLFASEILELYNRGVAVGDENMRFYPDEPIKRSEASAIVSRILFDYFRVELPKG